MATATATAPAGQCPEIWTLGQIAAMLGRPAHQVRYALKTREIAPVFRNGSFTAYDRDAIDRLKKALVEIDAYAGR